MFRSASKFRVILSSLRGSYRTQLQRNASSAHGETHVKTNINYSAIGAVVFGAIAATYTISTNSKSNQNTTASKAPAPSIVKPINLNEPEIEIESKNEDSSTENSIDTIETSPKENETESSITEPSNEIKVDDSTHTEAQSEELQPSATEEASKNEETTKELVEEPINVTEEAQKEDIVVPAMPSHAKYLIIGGGTTAMAAFKSIRANDPTAKVLVISEEEYKPYMRPPLSKDFWYTKDDNIVSQYKFKQWNGNERSVFFLEDEFYVDPKLLNHQKNGGVAVLTGKKVIELDARNKTARLNDGWEITYDKCLIATGGRPKNLPAFEKLQDKEKIILFRNIDDFKKLYSIAKQGKTITIVGGGFLGTELACALADFNKNKNGQVIQLFPESGNLGRILPNYLSKWTMNKIREEGVNVIPNVLLKDAKLDNDKIVLTIEEENKKQKWIVTDHVVVAVGLEPNIELASSCGLEVSKEYGGIVVNSELQARDSIWVAGDAACFYDIQLGRRRVEHHDHAIVSGRLAGENMTGAAKPYQHQSMFWSDVGTKIGFEAIGVIDSSLNTMGIFVSPNDIQPTEKEKNVDEDNLKSSIANKIQNDEILVQKSIDEETNQYDKGLLLYFKNSHLVGVLMWNLFERMPIARRVLASQPSIDNYQDIAKLFKLNNVKTDKDEEK